MYLSAGDRKMVCLAEINLDEEGLLEYWKWVHTPCGI